MTSKCPARSRNDVKGSVKIGIYSFMAFQFLYLFFYSKHKVLTCFLEWFSICAVYFMLCGFNIMYLFCVHYRSEPPWLRRDLPNCAYSSLDSSCAVIWRLVVIDSIVSLPDLPSLPSRRQRLLRRRQRFARQRPLCRRPCVNRRQSFVDGHVSRQQRRHEPSRWRRALPTADVAGRRQRFFLKNYLPTAYVAGCRQRDFCSFFGFFKI